MPYSPIAVLEQMGIPVLHEWLRDTWGGWSPIHRMVVIATGMNSVQERCVLAHEVEHVLSADPGCGFAQLSVHDERRADVGAARKLIAISDLCDIAQWAPDVRIAAAELHVTERMLRVRLHDLNGEGWPWPVTSKIAG